MARAGVLALLTLARAGELDCGHGHEDPELKNCLCDEGWKSAGITDTLHFMQGTCSQYGCVSDMECERRLDISGASCMVPGWNCYCGWQYAFHKSLTGYETNTTESAKCMG
ncbi:unnamed protein product, partial [Effrenium voratum]